MNKKVKLEDGVKLDTIFDECQDKIGVTNVIKEDESVAVVIQIESCGKVTYSNVLDVDKIRDFIIQGAPRYCKNNFKRNFSDVLYTYDNISNTVKYNCHCDNESYSIYKSSKNNNYDFVGKELFVAETEDVIAKDKELNKFLFMIMGYATYIIEKLNHEPLIIGAMKDYENELLYYIMRSAKGIGEICEIKNPNESKTRLSGNNVFELADGRKISEFSKIVAWLNAEYHGSILYIFNGKDKFPFDVTKPVIRCNVLLIQEKYDFSCDELYNFELNKKRMKSNPINFKKFIENADIDSVYKEQYQVCNEHDFDCKIKSMKEKIISRTAIVRTTAVLLNKCFGFDIDIDKIGELFIGLHIKDVCGTSTLTKDIVKTIFTDLKENELIYPDNYDEYIIVPFNNVKRVINKNYNGCNYNDILDRLAYDGLIKHGKRERSEGKPRYDGQRFKECDFDVIYFWREKIERIMSE